MPEWADIVAVYTSVRLTVETGIALMFEFVDNIASDLSIFVTATAAIYVALMGYSLLSGMINMSARDAGTRLAKVILVLLLLEIFTNFGAGLYAAVWDVPESLASFIAQKFNPLLTSGISIAGVSIVDDFDILMNAYAGLVTNISREVTSAPGGGENVGLIAWFIMMAPMFMTTISIFLAKMISAILFIIAPIVFALSLLGFSNTFLNSWFRSILVTFLTVIIVFIVGTVGLSIVMIEMLQLIATDGQGSFVSSALGGVLGGNTAAWSIPAIAPTGILSLFALMLITQSPTLSSAIIGATAINSQQATSFIQIGALRAAA